VPTIARSTPGSPIEIGTLGFSIGAPMKNDTNAATRPTARTSSPSTAALAVSMGTRRGTASRLDRIMPVEYSEAIAMTPRTQITGWMARKPLPRTTAAGSDAVSARSDSVMASHWPTVSPTSSAVKAG